MISLTLGQITAVLACIEEHHHAGHMSPTLRIAYEKLQQRMVRQKRKAAVQRRRDEQHGEFRDQG